MGGGGGGGEGALSLGCLTKQKHAICTSGTDLQRQSAMCCNTETEYAHQRCCLVQSWYADNGPVSPSIDLIMPGTWQDSY